MINFFYFFQRLVSVLSTPISSRKWTQDYLNKIWVDSGRPKKYTVDCLDKDWIDEVRPITWINNKEDKIWEL